MKRESFERLSHLKERMKLEKLSCRKRVALLCDYLDEELPAVKRRLVDAHRRSCLPCAQVLESLRRTVNSLRRLKKGVSTPVAARLALRAGLKRAAKIP